MKYRFQGQTIKLDPVIFDLWKMRFSAIPDFEAELWSLDTYYTTEEVEKWFIRAERALNNKHQEWTLKRSGEEKREVVPYRDASEGEYRMWARERGYKFADAEYLPEWTHRLGQYRVPEDWRPKLREVK